MRASNRRPAVARKQIPERLGLTELHPRWITPIRFAHAIPTGVSFDCPCCRTTRLSTNFRQPIDPDGLLAGTTWRAIEPAWDRTGEGFDTLSLTPSVDFSAYGHWHGSIVNGEVVSA